MPIYELQDVLKELRARNMSVGVAEIRISCPLASSRHAKGTDNTPSFFVNKKTGQCKCHGCEYSGNLFTLIRELSEARGENYHHLRVAVAQILDAGAPTVADRLEQVDYYPLPPKEVAGVVLSSKEQKELTSMEGVSLTLPESELDSFLAPEGEGLAYLLNERGLTPETIKAWEIKWHPQSRRVALPIRDMKGRLVGISGRTIVKGGFPKFLHSTGFNKRLYLYGENMVIPGGRGIMVEGNFDPIKLWQMGYRNAVAIMGAHVGVVQRIKARELFKNVVYIRDGDGEGSRIAARVLWDLQKEGVPVATPLVPDGLDPDQLSAEFLADILGPPDRT